MVSKERGHASAILATEEVLLMNTEKTSQPAPAVPAVQSGADKLALAQGAFERYYATCFWFMEPTLLVTEEFLPRDH